MTTVQKKPAAVTSDVALSPALRIPALLYDIPTTAKLMGTTTFAVRELCRSGRLKFVPIGHRWLISPIAMQEFIAQTEKEMLA
jgi:hypothetical protein